MTAVVLRGDAAHLPLPDASVDLIVTSPPYWQQRDYRDDGESLVGQIGNEGTPQEYVANLLECTREWMRALKPGGSIFVNCGDKYAQARGHGHWESRGAKGDESGQKVTKFWADKGAEDFGLHPKSLFGLPWRYALACIDDLSLTLRAEIIWSKPNGLPESVIDRVRRSHEQVFHFTKQPRYFSAADEIREASASLSPEHDAKRRDRVTDRRLDHIGGGRTSVMNPLGKLPGSVWEIPSMPLVVPVHLGIDHFAAYPPELCRRIILGWSPSGICLECGEGRRPVADREVVPLRPGDMPGRAGLNTDTAHGADRRAGTHKLSLNTITGYTCACPDASAPTRPALVADPFGGTGTTAMTASVLGRIGLTFDRSMSYCRLARWRTSDPGERARALGVPKPPKEVDGQATLFEETG